MDETKDKTDETIAYRERIEYAVKIYGKYHQWMTLAIFILASIISLDLLVSFHNMRSIDDIRELLMLDLNRLHESDKVIQSRITVLEQQGKTMQREHQEILKGELKK